MNKIYWGIILVLCGIIFFLRECSGTKCPATPIPKTDTVWQHSIQTVTVEKPIPVIKIVQLKSEPVTVIDTLFVTQYEHVDSLEILKDYLAKRIYKDTLKAEYGTVILNETVTQNKLLNRQATFNFDVPTVTKSLPAALKNKVFMGLELGGTNTFVAGGLQGALLTKKDGLYNIGVDFTTQSSFYFHFGFFWKIHL